jgi:hypothetical protein
MKALLAFLRKLFARSVWCELCKNAPAMSEVGGFHVCDRCVKDAEWWRAFR